MKNPRSHFSEPVHRKAFSFITLLLFLFISSPLRSETQILYEGDSIYNHIRIKQDGQERCMLFGRYRDERQTCLDMTKPDRSVFEYTGMMFVGFLFHPETKDVALIGLGGGYVPTVFNLHLPDVRLDTIEIDPLVFKLAGKFFSLKETAMQRFFIADGRQYLKKTKRRYDQIWIDAFNTDYIPVHITTKEFLRLAQSRLTKNGIVLQNVHNTNRLFDAQVATFRSVFRQVFIFSGERSGNAIVVGADNPLFVPSDFKLTSGLRFKIGEINLLDEGAKYTPDAEFRKAGVLTDDYNPANFLLHQAH